MKKLVFVAVVLAMTMGVFSETQAFLGFSKKVNKAEVKNEQAENGGSASILSINRESEITKLVINKEGTSDFSLLAGGAVVKSNTAGTLTAEISFGSSKVNLTINTNADTKVYRRFNGKDFLFGISEIVVGDILSIEGLLDTTAGSLTVTARKIKDFSVQTRDADYSGTIKTITATSENTGTFVLDLPNNEVNLTVIVNASTTIHKLAKRGQVNSLAPSTFGSLKVGDLVKNATGVANTQIMQLIATKVVVSEESVVERNIRDVFAKVVSIEGKNSMTVKTTAGVTYIVSFKNLNTVYNKWTISKKYSGAKYFSKTDGITEDSTLDGLALITEDKVWISGTIRTGGSIVDPSLIKKEFYK